MRTGVMPPWSRRGRGGAIGKSPDPTLARIPVLRRSLSTMGKSMLVAAVAALAFTGGAAASSSLPPLPARWPRTLELGVADSPGGAVALWHAAPFGFRY